MDINQLDKECKIFCCYLINQNPNKYVVNKYREGHEVSTMCRNLDSDRFDQLLINIAIINPVLMKMADVYTSMFYKTSVLRKKWVLLLAILESCSPTHVHFESVSLSSKTALYMEIFQKGLFYMLTLLLSTIILMPLHVILSVASKSPDR